MSLVALARLLILPPLSLFLLYGIGMLLRRRRPVPGRIFRYSAVALLFLLSTHAGSWLFVAPLEYLEQPLTRSAGAQAIVVLAAGRHRNSTEYNGQDIPDYITLGRLRYTAKLHRETGLPVLVSGGSGIPEEAIKPLAAGMVSALQTDFATPVKWIEDQSGNTAENAKLSASILKQNGIRHILLVTDAMHMRRAKMMFEQQGLEVIAAPTLFFASDNLGLSDLLPGVEGLRLSNYAIYEWLGIAWYQLRYNI